MPQAAEQIATRSAQKSPNPQLGRVTRGLVRKIADRPELNATLGPELFRAGCSSKSVASAVSRSTPYTRLRLSASAKARRTSPTNSASTSR